MAHPPRHQEFTGADLLSRFLRSDSGESFAELDVRSRVMCTWRCPAGHEYRETRAGHQYSRGCPQCATSVATRLPGLLRFWDDKRNMRRPTDVSAYDRDPCAWRCEYGHRFERAPYRVLATGHQCIECRREGKTPWSIAGKQHGEATLADAFPELAAQWDRERNPRGPEEYAPGSQRQAWWICPNGHSWRSPICHRTSTARHRASCQQCKAIAFAAPELAAELHPTLNPPGIAERVRKGSTEVLYWQCPMGHVYSASVAARLRSNYPAGCDTCRSIAIKAPELIEACWAYERNGHYDPLALRTSSAEEVWWVRVDCLDVPPEAREARHYELKRIGYRYRRYVNNPEREAAPIRAALAARRRGVRSRISASTAKTAGGSRTGSGRRG